MSSRSDRPDLSEMFAMSGGVSRYTLEPEANGLGRLLAWEEPGEQDLDDALPDEGSCEAVARGDVGRLVRALPRELRHLEAEVRDAWDDAVRSGDSVQVTPDGRVTVVERSEPEDGGRFGTMS